MTTPWDAFGSDSEEEETSIIQELHKILIQQDGRVQKRYVRSTEALEETDLVQLVSTGPLDAFIGNKVKNLDSIRVDSVIPGGLLILTEPLTTQSATEDWTLISSPATYYIYKKIPYQIQHKTCPWLPTSHDLDRERKRLTLTTISLSVQERTEGATETTKSKAVASLRNHGYCIILGIVDPKQALAFGTAAQEDFKAACAILQTRGMDLMHPEHSTQAVGTFRELSPREDYRADIRHGPALEQMRSQYPDFLRNHAVLREILQRSMNPTKPELFPGNVGRYNFDGSGPDGSFRRMNASPVGSVMSWPGAADQALHADTPHLFEDQACLPPHYINLFTPGWEDSDDDEHMGQTAILHGTHRLDVTTRVWEDKATLWKDHLVRPKLQVGDVLMFDCRILHFGLSNRSSRMRPMLYTNVTMHWFHDPKNWNNEESIFRDMV